MKRIYRLLGATLLLVSLCACQQPAQDEGRGTTGTAGGGRYGRHRHAHPATGTAAERAGQPRHGQRERADGVLR